MKAHRVWVATMAAVLAVSATVAPAAPAPVALAVAGPVAQWTFDEASGDVAEDAVGALDGTLSGGVTRITGDVPQGTGALAFDGLDDLVTVANNAVLEPQVFTLTAWVKGLGGGWQSIISKGAAGCAGPSWGLSTNGNLNGTWLSDGSGQVAQQMGQRAGGPVWDDAWHHVVFAYAGGTIPFVYVFVDGRRVGGYNGDATSGVRYAGSPVTVTDLVLGGPATACEYNDNFAGMLDDVRLYDRVISQDEVYAFLEPFETSVTVWVEPPVLEPYRDILYRAQVTPAPPAGSVTFFLTKDGEAEQQYVSTPVNEQGQASWLNYNGQHMSVGGWSVRGVFNGGGPAGDSASAPFAFQIDPVPTTVTLSMGVGGGFANRPIPLEATTAWVDSGRGDTPPGSVTFFEVTAGGDVELGTANLVANPYVFGSIPVAAFAAAAKPLGTYTYRARYNGSDTIATATDELVVEVGRTPTYQWIEAAPNPVQQHHEMTIQATTIVPGPSAAPSIATGSTVIRNTGTGSIVASGPVGEPLTFTTSSLAVGTHSFRAEYAGDGDHQASQSDPVVVTVTPDTVDATGVGVSVTTFYPYKDGYGDSVSIRGNRLEAIGVAIRVYSPLNRLVRSTSFPSGSGAYAYPWNGRTSTGTMLAAGKYKVVQLLTDTAGTRRTVTSYVNLSAKRLYTYTATYTKNATTQITRDGTSWIGWAFTLPSATVYKSLVFSIYAKADMGGAGFGPQDFTYCTYSSYWHPGCVTRWAGIPTSWVWRSVNGSPSKDRYGRTVRLYAWGGYAGAWVKYGRVKVVYGILK